LIEHLLPDQIDATLADIARILRPGGRLVLTTPHNEQVEHAKTICPDCGCVFHPWQHMGSFTTASVGQLLERQNLIPVECVATMLGGSKQGRALRRVKETESYLLTGRANDPARQPHLVCIARKPVLQ